MLLIIARARKDAKALSHAIKEEVLTLKGKRSFEEIDLAFLRNKIPIFFFGKEDAPLAQEISKELKKITPLFKVVVLGKKSVRNARLSEIIKAFEMAKAEIRLGFKFEDAFVFTAEKSLIKEIHPDYDAYFLLGKEAKQNYKKFFGIEVKEGSLIVRKLFNEEEIYAPYLKAIISKKIGEPPKLKFYDKKSPSVEVTQETLIEKNKAWLEALERVSMEFLKSQAEGEVGVPVSGGKDSTACLILAAKVFPKLKALYIKTSHEVPYTEEYVEELCRELGVPLIKKEVKFDVESLGLPTHENRWCTELKMKALKEIATSTLIVGDREAESRTRRRRAEVEHRLGRELFPLKYWSGAMVQLYILMHGIKLHPFYYKGFYRLGCTICPSLSEWEKVICPSLFLFPGHQASQGC